MTATSTNNRTTVRATSSAKIAALRALFQLAERLAPTVGARWAARIWCTLPNGAGRRRDDRPGPGEWSTITLGDGRRIAVETWGFGPPVYLLHGWGGWRGQLGAFVTPLVDAGFKVVAVDAPSHGESSAGLLGRGRSMGPELSDALTAAADQHGKPQAVIAHSFGCTAAALAVHAGLPADRLVMIAPSTGLGPTLDALTRTLALGPRVRARLLMRLELIANRPMADFEVTTLGRNGEMPPTLVVHDRDDKEVSYDGGARLASTWSDAELVSTQGLGHQRILRDPSVVGIVTDYLTR